MLLPADLEPVIARLWCNHQFLADTPEHRLDWVETSKGGQTTPDPGRNNWSHPVNRLGFQCATRNKSLVAHPGASWCARVAGASWFAFARMDPHLLPLVLILSTASNSEAQVAPIIIAFCHKSDQH